MKTQKDYRKQITALILAILTVFTAFVVTSPAASSRTT